jgi:SRSO17 transposase
MDEYCSGYKDLFPEVRSYECFKKYQTKIELASEMIEELINFGFEIELVRFR